MLAFGWVLLNTLEIDANAVMGARRCIGLEKTSRVIVVFSVAHAVALRPNGL
jgi:hypothetical protein